MEFLNFVFRDFWTFFGFFVFVCIFLALIKTFCDFIVELIHGKSTIQHINLPDGAKIEQKVKPPKVTNDVSGSISMSPADVSVRSN